MAATFKQFIYSKTSNEIDFMQGLIDLICEDGDVICEDVDGNPTTAAEQYADLTSASQAAFYFNFGDGVRLSLTRERTNDLTAKVFSGNPHLDNVDIRTYFTGSDYGVTTVGTRTFFIRLIKSDNLFYLGIGDFNRNESRIILFHYKTGENSGFGVCAGNGQELLTATMIGSDNSQIRFSGSLPYIQEAGKIDYIEESTFTSGGYKHFSTDEIKSCSTMSQYASIALPDGRNFFTIGTNAMVEVEEEE